MFLFHLWLLLYAILIVFVWMDILFIKMRQTINIHNVWQVFFYFFSFLLYSFIFTFWFWCNNLPKWHIVFLAKYNVWALRDLSWPFIPYREIFKSRQIFCLLPSRPNIMMTATANAICLQVWIKMTFQMEG